MVNKGGRPKGQKLFADMLRIAIREAGKEQGTDRLRDIADKLVSKAVEGDMQAIKEVADRLDGKPLQQTENMHEGTVGVLFQTINESKPDN